MSKLKINTIKLQALVAKAIKGAGFNKLLDVTQLMGIKVDGAFRLCTTDGSNYLEVSDTFLTIDDEVMDIAVDAEVFSNLVSKLTSDDVELELVDDTLVVTANGKYKLPLKLDDNGELFKFNSIDDDTSNVIGKLSVDTIATILNSIKPSLSTNAGSLYTNYYLDTYAIATDKAMLAKFDFDQSFNGVLMSREFVDLLGLATSDVTISSAGVYLIAKADNMIVRTNNIGDVSDYNVAGLQKMLDLEVDSYCKVNRKQLLSLLDRLAIFVGAYDDCAINLHFTNSSIEVSSLASDGVESVDLMETKNAKDFTAKININRLLAQLKAYQSDSVDLYYGSDLCIKLVDGKLTQVIALMR